MCKVKLRRLQRSRCSYTTVGCKVVSLAAWPRDRSARVQLQRDNDSPIRPFFEKTGCVSFNFPPIESTMEPDIDIRTVFNSAKTQRKELESSPDPISSVYQDNLQAAIASLEECRKIADRISLFSLNETEDDVSSGDLQ